MMHQLEIDEELSVRVTTWERLCGFLKLNSTTLPVLIEAYNLEFNKDIFIVERRKLSGRPYPVPKLLIDVTRFKVVVTAERPHLLTKYCQRVKTQHVINRLGKYQFESHSKEDFEELLRLNSQTTVVS